MQGDLELFLGRRPWESEAHLRAWDQFVVDGAVKHVELMDGLVNWSASVHAVEADDAGLRARVDKRRSEAPRKSATTGDARRISPAPKEEVGAGSLRELRAAQFV